MTKLWEPQGNPIPQEKSAAAETTTSTKRPAMLEAQPKTPESDDNMQSNDNEKKDDSMDIDATSTAPERGSSANPNDSMDSNDNSNVNAAAA